MTITDQFKTALAENLGQVGKQPEHATKAALPWDDATKSAVAKTVNDYYNLIGNRERVGQVLGVTTQHIDACFKTHVGR